MDKIIEFIINNWQGIAAVFGIGGSGWLYKEKMKKRKPEEIKKDIDKLSAEEKQEIINYLVPQTQSNEPGAGPNEPDPDD